IAKALEENNIIVNYQATPVEEGFTASGALRMGVSEMTRFGMKEKDFQTLATLISDLIQHKSVIKDEIIKFRTPFVDMQFCFKEADVQNEMTSLLGSFK
ncbi:MAG: glycine cleavage system protein T, partial [Deltaproteobacteria bacterium]|nr:glycine cleavage system protein T [Deltaproteobacteria bacterium]